MRARYYSPEMRRFINADIVPGQISDAVTLNRFAYANGNPVSNIDPFGLSADNKFYHLNNYNMQYDDSPAEALGGLIGSFISDLWSMQRDKGPVLMVLYDPNAFSQQAIDESNFLMLKYNTNNIITIPVRNKQDFFNAWELAATNNVEGMSLIFHGGPQHIYPNENIMADEVDDLKEIEMDFLRLLSCNGGHKDVANNIATAFKTNHDIDTVYAMDGSLSFYDPIIPGKLYWPLYRPRLSNTQTSYYKNVPTKTYALDLPNAKHTIYIDLQRPPSGLYAID